MIPIKDLRPGNLIHSDETVINGEKSSERIEVHIVDGKSEEVVGIDLDCCLPHTFKSDQINGIPLTPEILGRTENPFMMAEFDPERNNYIIVYIAAGDLEDANIKNISYLHEYQNLYFVLTGQELEIKL